MTCRLPTQAVYIYKLSTVTTTNLCRFTRYSCARYVTANNSIVEM